MKRITALMLCLLLLAPSAGTAAMQSWEQFELNGFYYSVPTGWVQKPLGVAAQEHYAAEVDDYQSGVLYVQIDDASDSLIGLSKERRYTIAEKAFEDTVAGDPIVEAAQRIDVNGHIGVTGRFEAGPEKFPVSLFLLFAGRHPVMLMASFPQWTPEEQSALLEKVALSLRPVHAPQDAADAATSAQATGEGEPTLVFEDVVTLESGLELGVAVRKSATEGYLGEVSFQFDGSNPSLEFTTLYSCSGLLEVSFCSRVTLIGSSGTEPVFIVMKDYETVETEQSTTPVSYATAKFDENIALSIAYEIMAQIGDELREAIK